jgi:5'-nucleotidase
MISRRDFLKASARGLAWFGLAGSAGVLGGCRRGTRAQGPVKVTLLHTNDVHSRIDPFPAGSGRNAGRAGAVPRARLIESIRDELAAEGQPRPLLLDAGDVFQGTPYFNLYRGEVDFQVMSWLGYDVMTVGNHDFDAGLERLAEVTRRYAVFDIVSANYDFSGTVMEPCVQPWVVRDVGPVRVGIFGLGVKLEGLVPAGLRPGVVYRDPRRAAREWCRYLRYEQRCDLIVCLSHLGNEGWDGEPGDQQLAREIGDIDLIIGGHSHTFMDRPTRIQHEQRETLVHQVGFAGINLGRVEFRMKDGQVLEARAESRPVAAS